ERIDRRLAAERVHGLLTTRRVQRADAGPELHGSSALTGRCYRSKRLERLELAHGDVSGPSRTSSRRTAAAITECKFYDPPAGSFRRADLFCSDSSRAREDGARPWGFEPQTF